MNAPRLLRVLFVDDETRVLQALQRMLRPLRNEWSMEFVERGDAALAEMAKSPFDVVVSDMRMPGMSGAELLTEVMKLYPSTVRLILSGQADHELVCRTVGPTHQYLSKPCDAETLKATVTRAAKLRSLLTDPSLRLLVGSMNTLPSLPTLYVQLVELMQQPDASLKSIGELVAKDMGMSAKILQLVNSAFFGLKRNISNAVEASSLLGVETIQSLVLSVHAFSKLDTTQLAGFDPEQLWEDSMTVATLAKRICLAENGGKMQAEQAFIAGMLHDCGKMLLAANLPEQFAQTLRLIRDRGVTSQVAEREIIGASHAEIGAYLLGLWGIADPIIEAVAYHHQPMAAPTREFSPLSAIHVASALCGALKGHPVKGALDAAYLKVIGREERLPAWLQIAAEFHKGDDQ